MEKVETIIVGGGQAGLATSYHLKQLEREHVIFEQAEKPAHAWRNDRWDSFTLVTPNWSIQLPGAYYAGNDPDGFMPKDEIVAYFERYVEKFDLPVQFKTSVLEEFHWKIKKAIRSKPTIKPTTPKMWSWQPAHSNDRKFPRSVRTFQQGYCNSILVTTETRTGCLMAQCL
jgi:cation diffusion facilitator CzcD-associated flavoprotein CzcO